MLYLLMLQLHDLVLQENINGSQKDAKVLPRMLLHNVAIVMLVPSRVWPSVLEARWTIVSDRTKSTSYVAACPGSNEGRGVSRWNRQRKMH
jgi:hypothetical protein